MECALTAVMLDKLEGIRPKDGTPALRPCEGYSRRRKAAYAPVAHRRLRPSKTKFYQPLVTVATRLGHQGYLIAIQPLWQCFPYSEKISD